MVNVHLFHVIRQVMLILYSLVVYHTSKCSIIGCMIFMDCPPISKRGKIQTPGLSYRTRTHAYNLFENFVIVHFNINPTIYISAPKISKLTSL